MKKSTLLIALGQKPKGEMDDEEMSEGDVGAESDDDTSDSDENDAIDTFLDDKEDPETRRAAFRQAVKLCMKNY